MHSKRTGTHRESLFYFKIDWQGLLSSQSYIHDILSKSSCLTLVYMSTRPTVNRLSKGQSWFQCPVDQLRMILKGNPCPGMITSAVLSASCRWISCTAVFILSSRQLSSSEQLSNKSPATSSVPTEAPFNRTLTSCPVWPGVGTTHTWEDNWRKISKRRWKVFLLFQKLDSQPKVEQIVEQK